MKNKLAKIIISIILVATLAVTFVACDPEIEPDPAKERQESVDAFVLTVVKSLDTLWTNPSMSADEMANLPNAGDYIVAVEMTKFYADVIDDSPLQTEKINNVTSYIASDKGQRLFKAEEFDGNLIFEFMSGVGLTVTDVENLVYGGLLNFIKSGDTVYTKAISTINQVKSKAICSAETRQNLEENLQTMQVGAESFANAVVDRQNTIKALKDAESGVKTIVSFAYNNAMMFGNGTNKNLITALQTGMLQDATTGEMATYLSSILDSVEDVIEGLEGQVDEVVDALDKVSKVYDKLSVESDVMDSIFAVIEQNKALPSLVPTLGDVVDNARVMALKKNGNDYPFIEDMAICLGDGYAIPGDDSSANETIAYARICLALAGIDYSATGDILESQIIVAKSLIQDLVETLAGDSTKDSKMNAISVVALLYVDSPSGTMIGDVEVLRVFELYTANLIYDVFKKAYFEYSVSQSLESANLVQNSAKILMRFVTGKDVSNVGTDFGKQWYQNVCAQVESKMASEIDVCYPSVKAEIDNRVDNFFAEEIYVLIEMASMTPVALEDEGYATFEGEVGVLFQEVLTALLGRETN